MLPRCISPSLEMTSKPPMLSTSAAISSALLSPVCILLSGKRPSRSRGLLFRSEEDRHLNDFGESKPTQARDSLSAHPPIRRGWPAYLSDRYKTLDAGPDQDEGSTKRVGHVVYMHLWHCSLEFMSSSCQHVLMLSRCHDATVRRQRTHNSKSCFGGSTTVLSVAH
jgi:hypothetical protein